MILIKKKIRVIDAKVSGAFALTIMIAESRPDEMEMMITVVMNCIKLIDSTGRIK